MWDRQKVIDLLENATAARDTWADRSPEQRLFLAVLLRSIGDLQGKERVHKIHAQKWFIQDDNKPCYGCEYMCKSQSERIGHECRMIRFTRVCEVLEFDQMTILDWLDSKGLL